uniref:NADH dehydrogenase subunit 1 n=1 Tax=Busonia albilateralis TaxID=2479888 RepID=UPI0024115F49|nr:NADH dehydrogenase subunit 1 [Busonia albilateralis]WEP24822.1 NADH dehydrogenase subunit 1 [Busonia albilateralis]
MYYMMNFIFLLLMVLISVGFFTLMERKVLSYMQIRKGPNKVGYLGLLQPFSDGLKLLSKEYIFPLSSNFLVYYFCPLFMIIHSLFLWCLFPFFFNNLNFNYGFLFYLCCSGLSIYFLVISGWSSNSIYSILGSLRGVSQAISYEVSLSLILYFYFFILGSYNFKDFIFYQVDVWFIFFSIPIFFCWLSCCLAETNRTPFDFSEGESELVSGFNIEYSSGGFALLFISEYSVIIFTCMITCLIFLGGNFYSLVFYFKIVFMCFFFVWVRSSLPRYRYDMLMYLAWKCYLPVCLNYMVFIISIKLFLIYHFFL